MIYKSIDTLKGVGEKRKEKLSNLGIQQISDLLYYLPYKYLDISKREQFAEKLHGEEIVSNVTIVSKPFYKRIRSNLNMTVFYVSDGSAKVKCTFFNNPHLIKTVGIGDEFIIYGTIIREGNTVRLTNPKLFSEDKITENILPYYRLPKGFHNRTFASLVGKAISLCNSQVAEHLSDNFREKYKLCTINYAIENIHRPIDMDALNLAKRRLSFDEMMMFTALLRNNKLNQDNTNGLAIKASADNLKNILSVLPYSLTGAQQRVLDEILNDMSCTDNKSPMNRLIQGDVGCGKTIVAIIASYIVSLSGYQIVIMAPTEILANQHYEEFTSILSNFNINIALLTSSTKAKEKKLLCDDLLNNKIQILIGTHAVLQDNVEFYNLGLTVTDEQHRFGVKQRSRVNKGQFPHKIIMSATPVPRTLALFLYGDLDISNVDEMPPGRKVVKTRLVSEAKRKDMYKYIANEISLNQQAYIVCPLITESEKLEVTSAEELYKELRKTYFKDIDIGLLHGKLKSNEKKKLLEEFKNGTLRALVSTTVIEVGINVPSATIMVVENAERFGLAQLHQLRGRVGRGNNQSWCFLSSNTNNANSIARLKVMKETNDGFEVSQKDLELRGPGEFFGHRQSGIIDYKVMSLLSNTKMLTEIEDAFKYLKENEPNTMESIYQAALQKYKGKLEDTILN